MSNQTPASPGPTIRIAGAADAAAVHAIVDAAYGCYIPRIGKPPTPMLDDYAKRIADGQVWVLTSASHIIGVLVLEETPRGLLLDNIAVAPDQQGKGHGRKLLEFAEAVAKQRGWNAIYLYTNALMTENIELYRRIGYAETSRVTEKGFDRVYMTKRLADP